jgi:hypothetical protein
VGKLQSQIRRAYAHVGSEAGALKSLVKPPKIEFSPEKLAAMAAGVQAVDDEWLASKSLFHPATVSSDRFLALLYENGHHVLVFNKFESQGQYLVEIGPPHPDLLQHGTDGIWFLSNPVDGHFHPNPRQENRLSRRSEESIVSWRYLVLENDIAPSSDWLRALVQLPLKIAAIYTSGGKSLHALVRLDAASKADWDRERDKIKPVVVTLGADPGALTAVRLTRLPGAYRGDQLQRLLYIDDEPDGAPIVSKPMSERYLSYVISN